MSPEEQVATHRHILECERRVAANNRRDAKIMAVALAAFGVKMLHDAAADTHPEFPPGTSVRSPSGKDDWHGVIKETEGRRYVVTIAYAAETSRHYDAYRKGRPVTMSRQEFAPDK
jgi:hypothetical protein